MIGHLTKGELFVWRWTSGSHSIKWSKSAWGWVQRFDSPMYPMISIPIYIYIPITNSPLYVLIIQMRIWPTIILTRCYIPLYVVMMNNNHHHHPHLHHSHQASLGSREVSRRAAGAAGAAGAAVARGGVAAFTWRRGAEILIFSFEKVWKPIENMGKYRKRMERMGNIHGLSDVLWPGWISRG